MQQQNSPSQTQSVQATIHTVADLERRFELHRSFVDFVADTIGGFSSGMWFVALQ